MQLLIKIKKNVETYVKNLENEIDAKEGAEHAENKNDTIKNLVENVESDLDKGIDKKNKIEKRTIFQTKTN